MEIETILVTGKLIGELERLIDTNLYRQSFRFIDEKKIRAADYEWADALVAFHPPDNLDVNQLKWVHSLGAGVDSFLLDRQWNEDVLLTRTICSFGKRISQYCLSYYLADLQKHQYFQENQQQKKWQPSTPELMDGKKVMIYGTGEIGQAAGQLFSQLGLEVYGVSLSGKTKPGFHHVYARTNEEEQLSHVDLVINTLPLTNQTTAIFHKEFFQQLNQAMFINVGRGASIVEQDLIDALNSDYIRQAVLDVFQHEPLPQDSKLWNHERIMITPHISAVTTVEEAAACFLETLSRIEQNQPLSNKVDSNRGY